MKKRLLSITLLFGALIILATCLAYFSGRQMNAENTRAEQIVAVNEIEQLAKAGETELVVQKTQALMDSLRLSQSVSSENGAPVLMCMLCIVFLFIVFGYIYCALLRPFDKLKGFAQNIARGDFELPLNYERSNYFGEFTWAFDAMRREVTKARSCEREAIENNKTVIATLSHDIKTPISSIRAYAEGLEANLDTSPEKRKKYLGVIMKKCDEVSRLTNDLFLHSLSDLDKLAVSMEKLELCGFLETAVGEIAAEQNDVHFIRPDFFVSVLADKNRLTQIAENLINNARKYAKTAIDISLTQADGSVYIHVRDYGGGIPDKDMPFIFDKFYRGENHGDEQGSGLGLYIVKYLSEKMGGSVLLHNHPDGLEAAVRLPILSEEP